MIATGCPLGCGMSLMVAAWTADAEAGLPPAQNYRFGGHVVVVQPGPAAAPLPAAVNAVPETSGAIQQARFGDDVPRPDAAAEAIAVSPGAPAASADGLEMSRRYREIYASIPFDRAEYEANPSYRHDATLELMFGKMRPTTIHRGHTTIDVNMPAPAPFVPPQIHPYGVNTWYAPYSNLYAPFYRPGYRVHRSF